MVSCGDYSWSAVAIMLVFENMFSSKIRVAGNAVPQTVQIFFKRCHHKMESERAHQIVTSYFRYFDFFFQKKNGEMKKISKIKGLLNFEKEPI